MEASIFRIDASYEVSFRIPALSQIGALSLFYKSLYEVFNQELRLPSDAIELQNGTSIATTAVVLTLPNGAGILEAKLDGFKAKFQDLSIQADEINRSIQYVKLFETAVKEFFADPSLEYCSLVVPVWLTIDESDNTESVEKLLRSLTRQSDSDDPFNIGATRVCPHLLFKCHNQEEYWDVGIHLEVSELPGSHLYVGFVGGYSMSSQHLIDSQYANIEKQVEHLQSVSESVFDHLNLTFAG